MAVLPSLDSVKPRTTTRVAAIDTEELLKFTQLGFGVTSRHGWPCRRSMACPLSDRTTDVEDNRAA